MTNADESTSSVLPAPWRAMEAAPRDGTLLRLLVEFEDHSTEDEGRAPTIGSNHLDHTGEDRWQFAGWCWTHDHWTEGVGTPIGWLPFMGAERPAEKYDDVLTPFLALMRRELHANSRKGDRPGWLAMNADTALLEVYWHVAKLSAAVKNNDGPAIMEHSADVANMAMMVLDVCGGLAWVDGPNPGAR